jgi:hypothetical protein
MLLHHGQGSEWRKRRRVVLYDFHFSLSQHSPGSVSSRRLFYCSLCKVVVIMKMFFPFYYQFQNVGELCEMETSAESNRKSNCKASKYLDATLSGKNYYSS